MRKWLGSILDAAQHSSLAPWCFESMSFMGRLLTRPLRLDETASNYVNLGSGSHYIAGFINIDFFITRAPKDYGADLRFPLKIASNTVNGIISEHTIEHLTYGQSTAILAECHRILKPGGVLRVIVPDLSLFIRNYSDNNQEWFTRWEQLMFTASGDASRRKRRLKTNLQAISFVTQEYGHVSCWDWATMRACLQEGGFRTVNQTQFREGRDPKLLVDQDDESRRFVSLYVEAVKEV